MRKRTFKVIKWDKPPAYADSPERYEFEFGCDNCERVAYIPHVGPKPFIIFIKDMSYVHEPGHKPLKGQFPQEVECRGCDHVYAI